jgi:hypothetical protein
LTCAKYGTSLRSIFPDRDAGRFPLAVPSGMVELGDGPMWSAASLDGVTLQTQQRLLGRADEPGRQAPRRAGVLSVGGARTALRNADHRQPARGCEMTARHNTLTVVMALLSAWRRKPVFV